MKIKNTQKILKYRSQSGFTLIELLVVITVIGILAAIALPNFLTQSGKAKQTEAKQNINAVSKSQQAHYLENKRFTNNLDEIGVGSINGGTTSTTGYYIYMMSARTNLDKDIHIHAYAKELSYRSYVGETVVSLNTGESNVKLRSIICENININNTNVHAEVDITNPLPYHTTPLDCLITGNARQIR